MSAPKAFVTSATGHQGSAVAHQLRALNWEVHTSTRNVDTPAAQSLSNKGIIVHQASWDDTSVLASALEGCSHLFLNLMPDLGDSSKEVIWAKSILSLAKDAQVQHVVYSSVFNLSELPGATKTHFSSQIREAKQAIENLVHEGHFKYWTILRPGYFMANLISPKVNMLYPGSAESGTYTFGYLAGKDEVLAMVDHEDIGKVAVEAFLEPERFHEADIKIVSQLLKVEDAIGLLAKTAGKKITARYLAGEELDEETKKNPMLFLNIMSSGMSSKVDIKEMGRWGFKTRTFQEFLQREKKDVDNTFNAL